MHSPSRFAEFERAMIVERVNSGLARAKAKGVKLGRGKKKDGERSADEERWARTCLTPLNTSPVNASRLPSRTTHASLGAGAVRYTFTVTDFHRLPFAGLPAHPSTTSKAASRAAKWSGSWPLRKRIS